MTAFSSLLGSIELFLGTPTLAAGHNPATAVSAEVADSALLVKELAQLEEEIAAKARSVSLQEAISTGLRANPQLLQAFSAIQQYEWQLIAAQRQWYPTLQLNNGTPFAGFQWTSFSQNYPQTSPTAPPLYSNNSSLTAFQPGAVINWNVIDPSRQPNINAASESLRQQKLLFDVSARNLILDIQQAYYAVQSTQQLIESYRNIYAINRKQLTMIEAQRSIGMATVLDVEGTRSQLFIQLNKLVAYTRAYIDQTATLAAAMALPDGTLATPSERAAVRGEWSLPLQQTIKQARHQREEILASLAAAKAARWNALAAIRSYWPVFQLVANGSVVANNGVQTYSYGGASSQTSTSLVNGTASIGLGFTWSIFDGGIQVANAEAARAQSREQEAQAASSELIAMQQVRSSYGQLTTSRVALSSAQQAYRSAELAHQASRARFAVGVGDITSLVQTIQQMSQAAEQVAEAIQSYNNALGQLYRYSATWPPLSQADVQQRLKQLRVSPTPIPSDARP